MCNFLSGLTTHLFGPFSLTSKLTSLLTVKLIRLPQPLPLYVSKFPLKCPRPNKFGTSNEILSFVHLNFSYLITYY